MKSDLLMAFKMSLIAGGSFGVQSKTSKEAKVIFPHLVKELEDYVNSPEYKLLIQKEQLESKLK